MHIELLPYQKNSAETFSQVAHLPYAVFLDSCFSEKSQGRFDILSANPRKIYKNLSDSEQDFVKINKVFANTDPRSPIPDPNALPFTTGFIGYLSYDVGRTLENIPSIAINDISLPTILIGYYDWSIVVDHREQKTYFISEHEFTHPKIKKIRDLLNSAPPIYKKFQIKKPFESNMSRDYYNQAFNEIKKNIIAGNCYQVNLAQRFSAEFSGSAWNAYQLLREKNPAPYAAFMQFDDFSILSLSPERFLKVHDSSVETKPIKGTSPRFADPASDAESAKKLLASEKDRAENIMIVDLLRNDLSRICIPGSVKTPKLCELESFSNVHHLVSTVVGKLSPNNTAFDLLKNCFPGGSITGAPKIAAMKIIESLEPHRRSLYCGTIFYCDHRGSFDSNIVIRTAICDQHKIHVYAGGGIVYDSNCEEEYQETLAKVGKIISTLNLTA